MSDLVLDKTIVNINAYNLTGGLNKAGDTIKAVGFTKGCLSLTISAGAGAAGNSTIKLQGSADGVAWFDITDASKTVSSTDFNANTPQGLALPTLAYPFIRAYFAGHAAITAGVITCTLWLK